MAMTKLAGAASKSLGPKAMGALSDAGITGALANIMSALGIGRIDPDTGYSYFLEIDGLQVVRFTKVSGLKMTTKVSHVREGGNNVFEHAMIDGQTFEPLIIEKGFYSKVDEFYLWMRGIHDPNENVERKSIALVVLNDLGAELCRFEFSGAFIMEYEGPAFDAKAREISFERMKIAYDWFDFVPASWAQTLGESALASGMAGLSNAL